MLKSRCLPNSVASTPSRCSMPDLNAGKARTTWQSRVFTVAGLLVCVLLAGCRTSHAKAASAGSATSVSSSNTQEAVQFSVQRFDSVKEEKYPWGWIRWMMNSELDPGAAQTFGIVQIDAGKRNQLHKHPNCEELLYVLSGSFESVVGSKKVVLHAGDIIRIPANVPHQGINNTNAPMRAVISYSSGVRQIVTLNSTTE
jgi:quercetin dioxygenase-like cupin family protein